MSSGSGIWPPTRGTTPRPLILASWPRTITTTAPRALHQQLGTPCPEPLWETEHYLGTDDSITNGLQLAQEIHAFMTVGKANAYHYWWLTGSGTGSIADNTANPAKRLFVMGNYSRFVRPNFYRIGATNTARLVSAYKDPAPALRHRRRQRDGHTSTRRSASLIFRPGTMTQWVTSATLSLANQGAIYVTNQSFDYVLQPCSVVTFTFSPMAPARYHCPGGHQPGLWLPGGTDRQRHRHRAAGVSMVFQPNQSPGGRDPGHLHQPTGGRRQRHILRHGHQPHWPRHESRHGDVTPARLTVTAGSTNVPYATPLPGFSATYSGLVGTDTLAAVSGVPAFSTPATNGSDPGHYPILLSAGTLTASNYSFNFVNGTVTILPATYRTNIIATANATTFTITWPASHTGWTLQVQTNALATGLGTNWADVAGSSATNRVVAPLNPAADAMFYRLRQ